MIGDGEKPDEVVLDILDRVERCGWTMEQAGQPHGMSRGAVAGLLKRIRHGLAASEAAPVPRGQVKAYWLDNLDGSQPARWWQAGISVRSPQNGGVL